MPLSFAHRQLRSMKINGTLPKNIRRSLQTAR